MTKPKKVVMIFSIALAVCLTSLLGAAGPILSKVTKIDRIIIEEDGTIWKRTAEIIMEDGVEISRKYVDRQVLHPGDSTVGEIKRVKDVAAAVWTAEVIATYKAKRAARKAKREER